MSPRVAARARKLRATRCLAIFVRTTAGVRSIIFSIHYGGRWRRELRAACQLVISPGDDVCGFRFFPLPDSSLNWNLINQMTVIANKESDISMSAGIVAVIVVSVIAIGVVLQPH